jgi:hypothetical protein
MASRRSQSAFDPGAEPFGGVGDGVRARLDPQPEAGADVAGRAGLLERHARGQQVPAVHITARASSHPHSNAGSLARGSGTSGNGPPARRSGPLRQPGQAWRPPV